jgi:hypothetical protein
MTLPVAAFGSTSARLVLWGALLSSATALPVHGHASAAAGGAVPTSTVHLRQDRPRHWEAQASYPHFESTSPVARLANRIVAARSRQHVNEFIRYAREHPKSLFSNVPYEHQARGTVTVSRRSLISLYVLEDDYLGGAHGSQTYDPMSFGIVRGRPRRLRLEDLFRPGQQVRRLCADRVLAKLRDNPRADAVRDGSVTSDKLAREGMKCVITPTGLLFLFDPYVLGSYAAGMFKVPIRFAEFGDALDPSGPLQPLLVSHRGRY